MTQITRELSAYVAGLSYDDLPDAVRERAKVLLLDMVGIALRARYDADSTPAMMAAAESLGRGGAAVIGDPVGYAPAAAALINGALAHSLDFDDTHAESSLHPSAPMVPAALAAAEMSGADGRQLIAGMVAGHEVICRLGMALVPIDHYNRGFHPSATAGAFAAAAAAGRVFGLEADGIANAFGIALSQAAGSMQFLENGAWTKRFQVGAAAMKGLIAASFARHGYVGAGRAIDGRHGFLMSYAPNPVPERVLDGLGRDHQTLRTAVKPYPCCRYAHAAIDAVIGLGDAHAIAPDRVASMQIGLPRKGYDIIGQPAAQKRNPQSVVDGQFSMPFVAAVALREGGMGWDDYRRHLADPETLDLCRRTSVVVDPEAEAEFPENMSGSARIRLADGSELHRFVAVPKGEPDNFMTQAELRRKFDSLVRPYLSRAQADALAEAILVLETAPNADAVLHLTRPAEAAPRIAAAGED
ncbi:MAG: MmgE/PrpD family protein [Kiloniellales bacterium]